MVNISKRDLAVIAGLAGAADFLAEGRFTAPLARALKTVIRRGGPTAARFTGATALRAAGTVASVGKTIALRHPVLTGGAIAYYTYKNRDELGALVEQGYEVIQEGIGLLPGAREAAMPNPVLDVILPRRKKRMTAFNKSVKKGMAIVKASTSYGKKGTINNAKKAFAAVTKVASAASKKKKAAKKGIQRKIYLGIKGLFK